MSLLTPAAIAPTAERLRTVVNRTPVLTSRTLNQRVGCEVFLKCENFQRVGAFKFRGAYNAVSQLSAEQQAAGVVTHSSGNHAQGLALAAKLLGVSAVVVMPDNAPANKRAATASYGAEIVACNAVDRERISAELVASHGYTLIHPYDNDHIILGAGSAAHELFDEVGALDGLLVPVGGGGLISGSALAAAAHAPNCQVIGVEPDRADDANRSWRSGQIVTLDAVPDTIADGLRTRFIGQRNLTVMRQYVHAMTTVSESDILETLEFIWTYFKIIVEPSSAVALAPLLMGHIQPPGPRIGVIISGGNVNVHGCGFLRQPTAEPDPISAETPSAQPAAPPRRTRILLTDRFDQAAVTLLERVGDVDLHPDLTQEQLINLIQAYDVVMVGPPTRLGTQVIKYGHRLQIIASAETHLDNIDVATAHEMGIQLLHAPGGNAVAIAEHTLGRLLMLSTQFGDGQLAGKTLGLIGYGPTGKEVAQRARAFDMQILVNQPRPTAELVLADGIVDTDLVALLQQADFVSLHVPFNSETSTILGSAEFAHMKPSATLINSGHTELVDEAALLDALNAGQLTGAFLSQLPPERTGSDSAEIVRQHPNVLVAPHITTLLKQQQPNRAQQVARRVADLLSQRGVSESLSLELVPVADITPHEHIDDKRVARLMERLESEGRLVNPPLTAAWKGRYVILDGATRFTSFKHLGYDYLIVQVVDPQQPGFELHTWYHAISHADQTADDLRELLTPIDGLSLTPLPQADHIALFQNEQVICVLMARDGRLWAVETAPGADRLRVMNALVDTYTAWGNVERTLLTDLGRATAQFPQLQAIALFPQFTPEAVFDAASEGQFLPAGLTRFVIPGRILRLNADLPRLKKAEPYSAKRAWFDDFLAQKLSRSRLRYYQEPVVLLDE